MDYNINNRCYSNTITNALFVNLLNLIFISMICLVYRYNFNCLGLELTHITTTSHLSLAIHCFMVKLDNWGAGECSICLDSLFQK